MREQSAEGEVWGAVELSEDEETVALLFSLSRTAIPNGMGVSYGIDYTIVKDMCTQTGDDPIETLALLKIMVSQISG